jgi:hypothetical protein
VESEPHTVCVHRYTLFAGRFPERSSRDTIEKYCEKPLKQNGNPVPTPFPAY